MLIFPIVNNGRILNVKVSLKNASKIRRRVCIDNILVSDINVNGKNFSEVKLYENKENNILRFIRENSVYQRNFFVATRYAREEEVYDLYEVSLPPSKINEETDALFIKALIDLEKEVPDVYNSRYLALDRLGFDKLFDNKKLAIIRNIVLKENDVDRWEYYFRRYGVADLIDTILFLELFEFTIIEGATISEETFTNIIKSFSYLHTNDSKKLKRYYEIALNNKNIYDKMIYISEIVLGKKLRLIKREK
ncbi:MAG: hypothetical protein MR031_05625 [Tenericutes bacterium]|nr:hypothetical protein [Mycoplasmatota bacterium]